MRWLLLLIVLASFSGCISDDGTAGEAEAAVGTDSTSSDTGAAETADSSSSSSQDSGSTDSTDDSSKSTNENDQSESTDDSANSCETGADADGDGIDDGCDPDLNDGPLGDSDGDSVTNQDDVCPGEDDAYDSVGDYDKDPDCIVKTALLSETGCIRSQEEYLNGEPSGRQRLLLYGGDDPETGEQGCVTHTFATPWTPRLF